ncbi:LuxR C-terminal-related transcriptional regulator [Aquimarina agarivorans]|uniref:LuxR C-terminal-related transcriptional regulator n=1 Tax=Aquimarina agarivorans TaxID=980584 RepID=UPI000248E72B|nr:response regulator transcription factor [Aquimarina agarivorans]
MKVLVADHHPITRKGILEALFNNANDVRLLPALIDGKNLFKVIRKEMPNIVFLELDLPNSNGLQTIKEIKNRFKGVKVFVFSHQPEEIYALSTIKSGASAYLCKTASIETLKFAFDRVARGGIYLNERLSDQLNNRSYRGSQFNTFKKLSTREVEVLNLLSAGRRNKEIANKLDINEKTVSTYKTRLLKKLKVDNLADLIHQSRILHIC